MEEVNTMLIKILENQELIIKNQEIILNAITENTAKLKEIHSLCQGLQTLTISSAMTGSILKLFF